MRLREGISQEFKCHKGEVCQSRLRTGCLKIGNMGPNSEETSLAPRTTHIRQRVNVAASKVVSE